MYGNYPSLPPIWQQIFGRLDRLDAQIARIAKLETDIQHLKTDIQHLKQETAELRQRSHTRIDKIEYHFDQLKVEKLEGTLNIGISPNAIDELDTQVKETAGSNENEGNEQGGQGNESANSAESTETADEIDEPPASAADEASRLFPAVHLDIHRYIAEEIPGKIHTLELDHQLILGAEYRHLLIGDLKKQVDQRIQFYLDEWAKQQKPLDLEKARKDVVQKMKKDIAAAIQSYFIGISTEGKEKQ